MRINKISTEKRCISRLSLKRLAWFLNGFCFNAVVAQRQFKKRIVHNSCNKHWTTASIYSALYQFVFSNKLPNFSLSFEIP